MPGFSGATADKRLRVLQLLIGPFKSFKYLIEHSGVGLRRLIGPSMNGSICYLLLFFNLVQYYHVSLGKLQKPCYYPCTPPFFQQLRVLVLFQGFDSCPRVVCSYHCCSNLPYVTVFDYKLMILYGYYKVRDLSEGLILGVTYSIYVDLTLIKTIFFFIIIS